MLAATQLDRIPAVGRRCIVVGPAILCLLLAGSPRTSTNSVEPMQTIALAVENNNVEVDLPGGPIGQQYLLVAGDLATQGTSRPLQIQVSPTDAPKPIRRASSTALELERAQLRATHAKLADRREQLDDWQAQSVSARFADERSFHLFVGEDDFRDQRNYREVKAKLVAVGKHCLVYVDRDDHPDRFGAATIEDVVKTFDDVIFPGARQTFGRHLDVDRNGRFTILFTHWLGDLSNGKVSLGGFVRGGDFYRDVDPPFSNQCDMVYLNANLQAGPHLRTLLAHEYTHAITFSQHVFGEYVPGRTGEDEEGWLNEAISHLAENLLGDGWSNLDYRISTYLSCPNQYRLVVPDYYHEGLWRCHGSRGSTFLFLRWCVDQYGPEILRELVQTNLRGVENIEVATRTPFEELFREWSLALSLAGTSAGPPASPAPLRTVALHGRLERRLLGGARPMELDDGDQAVPLAPTSFIPMRLRVPAGQIHRVRLRTPPGAKLQATLVRLPDAMPIVELLSQPVPVDADAGTDRREVVLTLCHRGGDEVHWQWASWERQSLPQERSTEDFKRAEVVPADELFAPTRTQAGSRLVTDPIDFGSLIDAKVAVKIVGVDSQGRKVTAWATVPPPPSVDRPIAAE